MRWAFLRHHSLLYVLNIHIYITITNIVRLPRSFDLFKFWDSKLNLFFTSRLFKYIIYWNIYFIYFKKNHVLFFARQAWRSISSTRCPVFRQEFCAHAVCLLRAANNFCCGRCGAHTQVFVTFIIFQNYLVHYIEETRRDHVWILNF